MNLKQQLMIQQQYTAQSAGKPTPKEPKAKPVNSKDALIAELEAMGVEHDGRWGVTRLQKALADAKAATK
jgi:hypothetical protein